MSESFIGYRCFKCRLWYEHKQSLMVCVGCTSLYDDFADSLCCSLLFYQSILSLCDILYFWTFSICIWTWELQMWTAFPMSTCMAEHRCALFEVIKCSGIPFVKHLPVESRGSGFSICIGPKCAKPSLLHIWHVTFWAFHCEYVDLLLEPIWENLNSFTEFQFSLKTS